VHKSSLRVATLLAAGALVLTACGSNDDAAGHMPGMGSSGTMSPDGGMSSQANDADVTFASDMITHHRQAVEMAQLAATRAESQAVKDLAARIESAQGPEIQTMTGWLRGWGHSVPEEMSGMDMSGSMPGMMSRQDMKMLTGMAGSGFDRKFLQMMIAHHRGAIEMARTEQSDGENAEARALAAQVQKAQTAEIAQMQDLLS